MQETLVHSHDKTYRIQGARVYSNNGPIGPQRDIARGPATVPCCAFNRLRVLVHPSYPGCRVHPCRYWHRSTGRGGLRLRALAQKHLTGRGRLDLPAAKRRALRPVDHPYRGPLLSFSSLRARVRVRVRVRDSVRVRDRVSWRPHLGVLAVAAGVVCEPEADEAVRVRVRVKVRVRVRARVKVRVRVSWGPTPVSWRLRLAL
eukprot:5194082-Pyramimonas_sp.AAC.1